MRRHFTTLVLFLLALNGIACACPSSGDSGNSSASTHSDHSSQVDSADDHHGDECAPDCGGTAAAKSHRAISGTTLFASFADDNFDNAIDDIVARFESRRAQQMDRFLWPEPRRFSPYQSPVSLKDRMLD